MPDREYMVPLTLALGDAWPSDLVQLVSESPVGEVLGKIGLVRLEVAAPANVGATLMFRDELALGLPGVTGLELVFGSDDEGHTRLDLALSLADPFYIGIVDFPIQLRFPRDALRPVIEESDGRFRADPDSSRAVAIGIRPSIGFSGDGSLSLSGLEDVDISTRFMIADSGLVIDIPRIGLYLTEGEPPPDGLPEGWRGVHIPRAVLHLPRDIEVEALPDALELTDCGIGSGGFTGAVAADWSHDPLSATVLGFTARLKRIEFAFQQNSFLRSAVEGEIDLSFFEATIGVSLAVGADGEFSATLSAVPDRDGEVTSSETPDGLITFTLPQLLEVVVESMRFDNVDDVFRFTLSGRLKPLLGGLDWPVLDIEALSIDENGNVDIDGGWLDLPEQQTLDLGGFKITLSEIGFGSREDTEAPEPPAGEARPSRQWIGVSGSIRLVEGLPLAASVDGLEVSWRPDVPGGDVKVKLEGVGVALEIPGTLSLSGELHYDEVEDERLQGEIFRGAIDLNLMALRTRIAGELIVGHLTEVETGESFDVAFVVLTAEFPAAIALGATGAGLYGIRGLVGVNIAPDRHASAGVPAEPESWYEWYKADRGAPRDVTKMQKWAPRRDHYVFGAGLTIGTIYDDGYTINARVLLAVLIPGPVILLEGRANLIKSRSEGNAEQGAFYLLAVIDCNAGTFQLNIDVQYELEDVISITGGVEAFFDFNDSRAWHVWLGQKEPDSKRIGADILSLFRVNAYLMIDAGGLATGAKAALEIHESYGPVSIDIAVGLSFDAAIFWNPPQAEGRIELFGELGLRILGIGLGILLRLLLEASAATPFWVHGLARFAVTLPFPLPSFDVTVEFTWEEPIPPDPVWPLLQSVELTHHLASDMHWTPARVEAERPVVPVDAVPMLLFARPLAGRSYRRTDGGIELMGHDRIDDWTFSYVCERTSLFALEPDGSETLVAQGPFAVGDVSTTVPLDFSDESLLTGADAQEPTWRLWTHEPLPGASVYEREDRPARDTACPPEIEPDSICVDFSSLASGVPFGRRFVIGGWDFHCREVPHTRGGRLETVDLWVRFSRAMSRLDLRFAGIAAILAFRDGMQVPVPAPANDHGDSLQDWSAVVPAGLDAIWIREAGARALHGLSIQRICGVGREEVDAASRMRESRETSERGSLGAGRLVLSPRTRYRLEVRTLVLQAYRTAEPTERERLVESFYFETSDGPGANPLNAGERERLQACHAAGDVLPEPHSSFEGGHALDAVSRYIARTVPAPEDDPFYFGLDPALVFRETYVTELYHPSWALWLRMRDRNGAVLGESVARRSETALPRTSPGAVTWQAARERGGCTTPGVAPAGDPVLSLDASIAELGPNRRYTLELVLRGCLERVLHQFSLRTSRYETPVAHLESGVVDGRQVVRGLDSSIALADAPADAIAAVRSAWWTLELARSELATALAGGSLVAIHDALTATQTARMGCDDACQAAYDALVSALGHAGPAARPPRTEVLALNAPDGILFVMDSAEPVEWTRWEITGRDTDEMASVARSVVACWNMDRTRAILLPREGPIGWSRGGLELEFSYRSSGVADLPQHTSSGTVYEPDPVQLRLNTPT